MSLQQSVFSLRTLCEEALVGQAPEAHAKGLELVALVYDDVPDRLLGHPQRLREALERVVGAAIASTYAGEVSLRGMLEESLPDRCRLRLWVQGGPAGGTGVPLGELAVAALSVARQLFGLMGASLSQGGFAESGIELNILLELPLAGDQADADGLAVAESENLTGRLVVLREPHRLSALALSQQLRRGNAEVLRCETDAELPARLQDSGRRADLLLLGLSVRAGLGESGALLQACRRQGQLPIVVLVGSSEPRLLAALEAQGADRCLSKPLTGRELRESLRSLLGKGLPRPPADAGGNPDTARPKRAVRRDEARALEIVGGDEALAAELWRTLLAVLPGELDELRGLAVRRDWRGMRVLAHRLRGSVSYCALTDLEVAAAELERASAQQDTPSLDRALQELREQIEDLLADRGPGSAPSGPVA